MSAIFAWLFRMTGSNWALKWYGIFSSLRKDALQRERKPNMIDPWAFEDSEVGKKAHMRLAELRAKVKPASTEDTYNEGGGVA
jgi:hypothetical protein